MLVVILGLFRDKFWDPKLPFSFLISNYPSIPNYSATFDLCDLLCTELVLPLTTTYAISAYHHWCCEFVSRSGRDVQHYVIKFVSELWQVGGFPRIPPPKKLIATITTKSRKSEQTSFCTRKSEQSLNITEHVLNRSWTILNMYWTDSEQYWTLLNMDWTDSE